MLLATGCASSREGTETADAAQDTTENVTATGDTTDVAPRAVPESILARQAQRPRRSDAVDLDAVSAGPFDQGKMWTFDHPPLEYFAETYDFTPDEEWFQHARLGALRIPGCSASFVSPRGLVLTNHHCGRSHATSVSRVEENILDNGFYASALADERYVEGMWADQLVAIVDVTAEVEDSLRQAQTDAERSQARQEAIQAIRERLAEDHGPNHDVEVISLYNGALRSAYVFRRYTDLRLVMIPELDVGFFGGDPDNFTYPRYTLDISLFRVYEEDDPVRTDYYFPISSEGVYEDDAVFVIGNPGSTFRLSTVAELGFRRDVQEPAILQLINSRLEALQASIEDVPEDERDALRNEIFSLQNAQKLYRGRVKALNDPIVMARRRDAQDQLVEAVRSDARLEAEYGDVVEAMRYIQQEKRAYADAFWSFLSLAPPSTLGAAALRRALVLSDFVRQGAPEDMRDAILEQLEAVADQPPAMQRRYLTERFRTFVERFGAGSEFVAGALQGRSPEEAARHVVEQSVLVDGDRTADAVRDGQLSVDDPALRLVYAMQERLSEYRSAMAGLSAQEQEVASRIGRARYAVYGTDVPPDATFSLRIADGVVKGYPYNGTVAPPYTTYYGLYDHYYSYGPETAWHLPDRWLSPPDSFEMKTPLNFASTNDTIGGNSGSAVINTDLQLVGLLFDGNIESLGGDFIYMTERSRSISVDARGILEALDEMYDADRLVLEAQLGRMVETEAEADAVLGE